MHGEAGRVYTRSAAEALIGPLTRAIEDLRAAREVLAGATPEEGQAEHATATGGGRVDAHVARAALVFGMTAARVQGWNVVLRDLESGICDFPARRHGRDVWLCWRFGEADIAFWHEIEGGFAGRRPVDGETE